MFVILVRRRLHRRRRAGRRVAIDGLIYPSGSKNIKVQCVHFLLEFLFFYSNTLNPKPSTFQIFSLPSFSTVRFPSHFTHKTHRQTHRKYKNVFFDVHRCFREAHLQGTPPPVCPRTEDAFSVARPRARALSDAKSAVQRVDFFVFFFCEAGTFFSAPKTKRWITHAEKSSNDDDDVNDDDANAGVYFFTPSRRKNAHASRARKCSRDSMRPSTRGRRRRVFVVVSFSHARRGRLCGF